MERMRPFLEYLKAPLFRYAFVALVVLTVPVGIALSTQRVKVRTGIRVICTYGELLEDNTKWISVPKSDVSKYGVETRRMLCSRHRKAEKIYAAAMKSLAAKDYDKAEKLLSDVAAIDPNFKDVGQRLTQLNPKKYPAAGTTAGGNKPGGSSGQKPGSKPGGSPGGNGGNGGNGGSGGNESVVFPGSLLALLPDSVQGYDSYSKSDSLLLASRTFRPEPNPLNKQLMLIVEFKGLTKDATRRVNQLKTLFSKDRKTERVEGRVTYLGVDGSQAAAAFWQNGGLVYEIAISSSSGPGRSFQPELLELAERYF